MANSKGTGPSRGHSQGQATRSSYSVSLSSRRPGNMAPQLHGAVSKKEKRMNTLVVFGQDLLKKLSSLTEKGDNEKLTNELDSHIRAAKSITTQGHRASVELDSIGTDIWNLCIRLGHDNDQTSAIICRLHVLAKVFAFQLLTLAHCNDGAQPSKLIRLAKVAIKTGRSCIDRGEIEFALLALQKAVDYNGSLQSLQATVSESEQTICRRLEVEYFILRTVVSWKEGRLDVAEHMYGKSERLRQQLDTTSAEDLADALFEIGNDLLQKKDHTLATKWLERAHEFINSQQLDQLSRNAIELRLSISQALIHAFLGLDNDEGLQRAENHVAYIESELGDKLVVQLLRLEILQKASREVFDGDAYADILRRMIKTVSQSDSTFKLLISHIRKLDDKSPTLAIQVLDQFITTRVVPSEKEDWIERTILLRILISTNRRDTPELVESLRLTFDRTIRSTNKPLTMNTALAALTLIWKKVEANTAQGQLDLCDSWCNLALHPLLEQIGPINTGKIARKSLLCALDRNDLEKAYRALESINETVRSQPMTIYLAYKPALRKEDADMASQCIEAVSKSASKDPKFLYACCLDALHSGDKFCTLRALQLLADKHEFREDCEIHLLAVLRATIRVQVSILDGKDIDGVDSGVVARDLCGTFEAVVTILARDLRNHDGSKLFTVGELDWFSKNAYNLGIKYAPSWDLHCVIRMCNTCVSISENYPSDLPSHEMVDISLRSMFCHFIIATALIALARSEDIVETQLQNYLQARKHIAAFGVQLQNVVRNDDDCNKDLDLKLATLLVFDFEAALGLMAWDDLGTIARNAGTHQNLKDLQALADSLLRSQAPTQVKYSSLRIIINEIFKIEHFDNVKLAKYMRCLLQITISDSNLAASLIEDICGMIKQSAEAGKSFPAEELQWFATTAFNQALDHNVNKNDDLCQKWISHAFSLAHHFPDGGVLEKMMQENYTKLTWEEK